MTTKRKRTKEAAKQIIFCNTCGWTATIADSTAPEDKIDGTFYCSNKCFLASLEEELDTDESF